MSQMNKGKGNWKSATPVGVQTKKAMENVKHAISNVQQAQNAVSTAGPGKHNEALKHLEHADKQNTGAQNQYSALKEKSDKMKKLPQGQAIGSNRTPKPTTTTAPKTGLGNSGAKSIFGGLGKKK